MESMKVLQKFIKEKKSDMVNSSSLKQYEKILNKLFKDIHLDISEVTSEIILEHLDKYYGSMSEATYNHAISVFSSFFKYCLAENIISTYPVMSKCWRKPYERPLPHDLDSNQIGNFKYQIEKLPLRDHLINNILEDTGLRRSELVSIQIKDINLDTRSIAIIGKRNRKRFVHFSEECAYLIKKYIEIHPHKQGCLFINNKHQPISDRSIYNIASMVLKNIVNRKPYGPHVLRHLIASTLLSNGADMRYIADFLGHYHIKTTKIYAKMPTKVELQLFDKYVRW